MSFEKLCTEQDIYFKFDELHYLGKVKSHVSVLPGIGRVQTLTFKLPNDSILYIPMSDLEAKLGPRTVKDHHSGTPEWVQLASSPCPVIDTWAQGCLGTHDIHSIYMYSFPLNRLEIMFYNERRQLSVTFEPGYPETPFWDAWIGGPS